MTHTVVHVGSERVIALNRKMNSERLIGRNMEAVAMA
jgi:hypothetical protein